MGFFDKLNKIWSGADFWQGDENRRQREQFAQEDKEREEEQRRQRDAQVRNLYKNPPQDATQAQNFDFSNPLAKVGSQSQYQNAQRKEDSRGFFEKLGDKFEANSPQDIAARRERGEVDTYQGPSFWGQAKNQAVNLGRETLKTPERLVTSVDDSVSQGQIDDINAVLEGKKDSVDIFNPENKKDSSTGLLRNWFGLKKQHFTADQRDELLEIRDALQARKDNVPQYESGIRRVAYGSEPVDSVQDEYRKNIEHAQNSTGLFSLLPDAQKQWARENPESAALTVGTLFTALDVVPGGFGVGKASKLSKATGAIDDVAETGAKSIDDLFEAGARKVDDVAEEVDDGVRKVTVSEDAPDIPGTLKKVDNVVDDVPSVKVDDGISSTNLVKKAVDDVANPRPLVPDVTNPIALGKADGLLPDQIPEVPIADFSKAENGSLQKAIPTERPIPTPDQTALDLNEAAARGDVRVNTDADAQGNPTLISDAQVQRELAEKGIVPERGDSVVASGEEALQKASQQSVDEQVGLTDIAPDPDVDLTGAAAPRTRAQVTDRITDDDLRADVLEAFPEKQTLNLEQAQSSAKAKVNNLSDDELVARFGDEVAVTTPEGFFTAVDSIRRLERIGTPQSNLAVQNAVDAVAEFSSKSGQNLRTVQILFDDMPVTMKVDYLINKLGKAGSELTDIERTKLVNLIEFSDEATTSLRTLEDQAQQLLDSGVINNKNLPDNIRAEIGELTKQIDEARLEKEIASGEAWKFYQQNLPKGPLGKRAADMGRTLMLSSPSGRIFDVLSTSATTADDLLTRGVSNLIGKGVNLVKAPGTVTDTISAPRRLFKGLKEGFRRSKGQFQGEDFVEDFLGQAKRATRGDINTGGGKFRQFVRSAVETPTNLTRGLREEELFRQGMKEASEQGLKGPARKAYAELRSSIPGKQQLHQAVETHMKANMLHDNKISRGLNQMALSLDNIGQGWLAVPIRNQIAPFTSWLGGNLHRALTDKNVLYNVGSAINQARKGNLQGVVDDIAKLTVNTGEAYAVGMLLTEAGIITTTDANGDDYAGLYFHIGDRYIPVAIAGTASVPLILGNAVQQAQDAIDNGENPSGAFIDSLTANTIKNTGVASVFGGENNLQSTVSQLANEDASTIDALSRYGGNIVRQYIPGVTGDINAALDQNDQLNPTGEAPETRVTYENPETGREKTDTLATEINKTKARIPFLSQSLDRKEGTASKDLVDRVTKGNRETGSQVQAREEEQAKADTEKDRIDRGVPETTDGVKSAIERGEWDLAIEGYQWQLEKAGEDGEISDETKKGYEDDIKVAEITRDGGYEPSIINLYKDTSLTEWRDLGDPDSDSYDPKAYNLLAQYDKERAKADVSEYSSDHGKTRYYTKDSKRGGGKSGSGKKPKFATDIATQSGRGYSFAPIKAQSANFAQPESAIPQLEKVPNYDNSKLKKISVTKGRRA